jgi:hypothetical protein
MLIAGGVLLLGLAVGGWFGFRWISRMRIESEAFRLALGRTVSRLSGVTVAFERVSEGGGGSLSVEAIHVQPGPGMLAESAEFRDASALLTKSSWVGSEWGVTSVLMREGKVRFNPVRAALPADSVDLVPLPVGVGRPAISGSSESMLASGKIAPMRWSGSPWITRSSPATA